MRYFRSGGAYANQYCGYKSDNHAVNNKLSPYFVTHRDVTCPDVDYSKWASDSRIGIRPVR